LLPDTGAADVVGRLKALSDGSCFLPDDGLLGDDDDTEEMEASDSRLTADKTGILMSLLLLMLLWF